MFHVVELSQRFFVLLSILIPLSLAGNTRYYPLRHPEEAAVIEWGNSAIISALDAVVADFGPQTNQAALMEVETAPIFAEPLDGTTLTNKDDIAGNVVVMTDTDADTTPVQLATAAQAAGAAALIVVHVDDNRPDEAPRFQAGIGEEEAAASIDIPVVTISMTSASVLAMATLSDDERRKIRSLHEANGLPERFVLYLSQYDKALTYCVHIHSIRLYAGEDRPFFEDIEADRPTLYLIHNLLTAEECESLVNRATPNAVPITQSDPFSYTEDPSVFVQTSRATLWQGDLQTSAQKAVSERISQVTGFPATHFSDFIVDILQRGSYWKTHADSASNVVATVHVFLTDGDAEWVYAHTHRGDTIRIRPRRGMAIVHHTTDPQSQRIDLPYVKYAVESVGGPLVIARKFMFATPLPVGRRFVLPLLNGYGIGLLRQVHDLLVDTMGPDDGTWAFDAFVLMGGPILLLGLIVQSILLALQQKTNDSKSTKQSQDATKNKKRGGRKKKD